MKRALITGITGQDGAYLVDFLLRKGYKVFGIYRRISTPNFWRLQSLDVFDKVELIPADLGDSSSLLEAVNSSNPDEIYNLAAQSFVGASFEQPTATGNITGMGVTRLLEAVRHTNLKIKFYNASTSELYGQGRAKTQNEQTLFRPASPYGAAKLYGHWMTRIYREAYKIFACNGILFNHESPLRGMEFVTRKISNTVAKISLGIEKEIFLGNIETRRDWGFSKEYVEAMWLMLQQDKPDDYVVATNETHSIKEFAEEAFKTVGLDWEKFVKIDKRFFRPLDVHWLKGDYSKAKRKLGWQPKTRFRELVKLMIDEDVKRWKMWLDGKSFPWDAQNYPSESRIISRQLKMDK